MKYLITVLALVMTVNVKAEEKFHPKDRIVSKQIISETAEDINTPTPEELEGATITVQTKDGKTHKMSANSFKVVKRKQQFKNKKTVILEHADCPPKIVEVIKTKIVTRTVVKKVHQNKNLLLVGARYDYKSIDGGISNNGQTAWVNAKRGTVLDLSYVRRRLFDSPIAAGVSVDTNGTPRGMLGVEF